MSTIRLYRITHWKHAEHVFSGEGGLHAAGRWHSRGRLVCYASESLALAVLEQIGRSGTMSRISEMMYSAAELDEAVVYTPQREDLPDGWEHRPVGPASQRFGDAWLESGRSVALRVPSVILPEGFNFVLNPCHPAFDNSVNVRTARPLDLDPRLLDKFKP